MPVPKVDLQNSKFLIVADRNDKSVNYQYVFFSNAYFIAQELIQKYEIKEIQIFIVFPNLYQDIQDFFVTDAFIDLGIPDRVFKFQIPQIAIISSFSILESIETTTDTELYVFLFDHCNTKKFGKYVDISYPIFLNTLHNLPHKKNCNIQ